MFGENKSRELQLILNSHITRLYQFLPRIKSEITSISDMKNKDSKRNREQIYEYGKCPKILKTKVSDKISYANSADPDQNAPEGAV